MVYDLKKQRAQSKGKELIIPVKSVCFVPPGTTLSAGTASNNSEMIALASDTKRAHAESPRPDDMQVM